DGAAPLPLWGLPAAGLEPAQDQGAVALGQRVGDVLGQVAPGVDPEEGGVPVLPGAAVIDAGGDGQTEAGHAGPLRGEADLGVVGEVADQGDERLGHGPSLGLDGPAGPG